MSRIRSRDTQLEVSLQKLLDSADLRYERQHTIYGRPDFAFPEAKVAVFCDSHFWHGYRWEEKSKSEIKSNRGFWIKKIEKNMRRDMDVNRTLGQMGWTVIRLWEHELLDDPEDCLRRIREAVRRGADQR